MGPPPQKISGGEKNCTIEEFVELRIIGRVERNTIWIFVEDNVFGKNYIIDALVTESCRKVIFVEVVA